MTHPSGPEPRMPRRHRMRGARAVLLDILLPAVCTLSACTMGPAYQRPAVALPDGFREDTHWRPATASGASGASGAAAPAAASDGAVAPAAGEPWWRDWHDPTLDALEQRALSANPTIAEADANYGRSRALISEARAALYPSVSLGLDPSRAHVADYTTTHQRFTYYNETDVRADLDVHWEVDLWGKARRGLEAARDTGAAGAATRDAVRLSVSAALAEDYLLVRESDLQLDRLRAEQQAYARMVTMTRGARQQGLETDDDVLLAQNAVSDVEARIAGEERARAREEHAVAALLGVAPGQFSIAPDPGYRFPMPDVAPVMPSALLERRPDIVAAERQVAAANARIGVAQAAYYPDLLLGASVGGESTTLAGLLGAPARIWSLGPTLALSLFDAGHNTARLHAAQADYDAVAARYRATVIGAMQEVEDDLARRRDGDRIAAERQLQWQRATQLQKNQALQRRLGLASEIGLIRAQIAADDAQRRWQASAASASLDRIALVKSIGGGWSSVVPNLSAGN